MKKIMNFLKREDGLELAEYAVMGSLIIVALIATIILFRAQIIRVFTAITAALTTV